MLDSVLTVVLSSIMVGLLFLLNKKIKLYERSLYRIEGTLRIEDRTRRVLERMHDYLSKLEIDVDEGDYESILSRMEDLMEDKEETIIDRLGEAGKGENIKDLVSNMMNKQQGKEIFNMFNQILSGKPINFEEIMADSSKKE